MYICHRWLRSLCIGIFRFLARYTATTLHFIGTYLISVSHNHPRTQYIVNFGSSRLLDARWPFYFATCRCAIYRVTLRFYARRNSTSPGFINELVGIDENAQAFILYPLTMRRVLKGCPIHQSFYRTLVIRMCNKKWLIVGLDRDTLDLLYVCMKFQFFFILIYQVPNLSCNRFRAQTAFFLQAVLAIFQFVSINVLRYLMLRRYGKQLNFVLKDRFKVAFSNLTGITVAVIGEHWHSSDYRIFETTRGIRVPAQES